MELYFKCSIRKNPDTSRYDGYYRLVESYRNLEGRVCHRTLLKVGFLSDYSPEQLNQVQASLNDRYENQQSLFPENDAFVKRLAEELWERLLAGKRIDVKKAELMIKVDTMRHENVREIGAEWLSYNIWNQLELTRFLQTEGWKEEEIQLAATQIISRAVYPASELKTSLWIKENSAVCELTGYNPYSITKDKLYGSALKLYSIKDKLEKHLSARTNELFDLEDKIILYDLTNTYFEGRKLNSKFAKHGRSKEKRKDAKLVVLAMVVNVEGFIKYTAVYEGNIADCATLESMIEKLATHTCSRKPIIVLDAGIATEDNLDLIKKKGYHYVCVSRTKIKDYTSIAGKGNVILQTKNKQEIQLKAVSTEKHTDYFLEVTSAAKAKKEEGMKNSFEHRIEEELQKVSNAIQRKGGVKTTEKVYERIGRIKEKYPSVHSQYIIEIQVNKEINQVVELKWSKDESKNATKEASLGVYFLRTDLEIKDEAITWNIYNTIREIESSFRCLKTDLDLRPVYHQNDDSTMAHLHLAILAYWLVNTMRYQLKAGGINHSWSEIVRIGNTQKVVTTSGTNTFDKIITVRKCSEPAQKLLTLLSMLKIKQQPFTKRKSVVHKPELKKNESAINGALAPP
ncbi:MAG: IS1634 family transposase [Chitinophagaceae bacterium]